MAFSREFKGIGAKYSRNIMMDTYHPEFRDSIAIDQRIKKVSRTLGLMKKRNSFIAVSLDKRE